MSDLTFLRAEDKAKISEWRQDWDAVLRDGVIVEVNISQYQPYARLTNDRLAQMGARFDTDAAKAAIEEVVKAGSIYLVPKEFVTAIRATANRARELTRVSSYGVLWGRLLPATAYESWRTQMGELEATYWSQVAELCDGLEGHLAAMRVKFAAILSESYDKLARLGQVDVPKGQFVSTGVEGLVGQVPNADAVRSRYSWAIQFRWAPMTDEIAEADARAERIRAESRVSTETLSAERKAILDRMQRDVAASVEKQKASIEESLAAAEGEFYKTLSRTSAEIVEAIDRNGSIGAKPSQALRGLITQIRALNVFDDQGLETQANALEAALEVRASGKAKGRDESLQDLRTGLAALEQYGTQALEELPRKRGIRRIENTSIEAAPTTTRSMRRVDAVAIDGPVTTPRRMRRKV